jgi:hypothetical protein
MYTPPRQYATVKRTAPVYKAFVNYMLNAVSCCKR